MVETRAGVAAGDGKTRGMNQRADFHAKRCGRSFQSGFQIGCVEYFERSESVTHRGEPRFVFRHEMFRDSFRVVLEVIPEIETAVSRQLAEDPELSFAGLERGPHVIGRKF